ncbi:hypothetical protein [Egicoccus halophilus]|uniref:Uncharacterized protein n=1 Tax=Egicoccus halophilus TaxID=1670830 RepID=A0A8J3EUB6_9ACTN|nr:hypothetical protein [Egicoccus halophilus]GGI07367.1 hypothetical protein GCM10011354_23730 [Egicoccus halophilus]
MTTDTTDLPVRSTRLPLLLALLVAAIAGLVLVRFLTGEPSGPDDAQVTALPAAQVPEAEAVPAPAAPGRGQPFSLSEAQDPFRRVADAPVGTVDPDPDLALPAEVVEDLDALPDAGERVPVPSPGTLPTGGDPVPTTDVGPAVDPAVGADPAPVTPAPAPSAPRSPAPTPGTPPVLDPSPTLPSPSPRSPTCETRDGDVVCDGQLVRLARIFLDVQGQQQALVQVDDGLFLVPPGQVFARAFFFDRFDEGCGEFGYLTETFRLCLAATPAR